MKFYNLVLLFIAIAFVFAQQSDVEGAAAAAAGEQSDVAPADGASPADVPAASGEVPADGAAGADVPATSGETEVPATPGSTDAPATPATPETPAAGADGEGSDDYGDAAGINQLDNGEQSDAAAAGALPVAGEQSDAETTAPTDATDKAEGSNAATVTLAASGAAAAAAAAGLFIWMKRSKRQGLESIRRRISMV